VIFVVVLAADHAQETVLYIVKIVFNDILSFCYETMKLYVAVAVFLFIALGRWCSGVVGDHMKCGSVKAPVLTANVTTEW